MYNRVCWLRVCDGRGGQLKGRFNALAAGGMFVENSPGCVGLVSVMRLVKHCLRMTARKGARQVCCKR